MNEYNLIHAALLVFDFDRFPMYDIKALLGLAREFQGASSEPNFSFLTLFVWEISKDKSKSGNMVFSRDEVCPSVHR